MSEDKTTPQDSDHLVVVGSSAGGIEALSILVSTLRLDFPAPIVLAQHLDPNRPSYLGSILERRSTLPIVVVQERTPLEPGKIYVVPSNRHVIIKGGRVDLQDDRDGRPRPSVDLLLSTAAESYGEHLVAVILTGSGSDGAAGAVEVKNKGGIVIIQNPHTARYPSMPQALPPTAVDHVADIEKIGPLLNDVIKGVHIEPEEKVEDLVRDLLGLVGRETNVDFRSYKSSTILRRIARRMAVVRSPTIPDYRKYVETHPGEINDLVMAFLIKVTEFFRDPDAFKYISDELLPRILARGEENGRTLRVWSAGCATGEEPYSLAMVLADRLGNELADWNVKIFATDLDEEAVSFARRGLYPGPMLRELPDNYQNRYFEPIDQGYRISKTLRQMIIFGQQDLSRAVPFPRIDLVVCRNLLIYFKPELQQEILDRFAYSLYQTHGYLFLGKAETARPSKNNFELVSKRWKVYRCVHGSAPITPSGTFTKWAYSTERPVAGRPMGAPEKQLSAEATTAREMEIGRLRRYNDLVFRLLPLGVVVIDRSYRIVTINARARRLLGIREVANDQDFLHAVRGLPYVEVRAAIDSAFREASTTTGPIVKLELSSAGTDTQYLTLTLATLPAEGELADQVVISVSDTTDVVRTEQQLEMVQTQQKQLLDELSLANKRLSEMNKELQDANEGLQTVNEELMLAHEELQAANEEFEATNEELQATNEEPETNNEELQATNEELATTNDELSARTVELQDLTKSLASERVRLAEMIELAPFYILVLRGPSLLIDAFNPRLARMFEGREVIGHSFDEIFQGAQMTDLIRQVREVYKQDKAQTTSKMHTAIANGRGETIESHFVYTIVPSHDSAGRKDGLVIYAEEAVE